MQSNTVLLILAINLYNYRSFGSTGTITGTFAIKTGKLMDFSQQQLMDCSWDYVNQACNGGEDYKAYNYIMKTAGFIMSQQDYGAYMGQDMPCHFKNITNPQYIARLVGYKFARSAPVLLDAIYTQGPISVSINASPDSFKYYHSGVYNDPTCKGGEENLDHSVLAVGFGVENGQQYYLIKNSWSTYWGWDGYIKIAVAPGSDNSFGCGVSDDPTYVLLA